MRATTTRRWCTAFRSVWMRGDRQYFRAQRRRQDDDVGTNHGLVGPSQGGLCSGGAIEGMSPDRVFRKGIAFIPEDRRIFATLSVEENLISGYSADGGPVASNACSSIACSDLFHACASGVAARQDAFPAGNSRCWRSAAPWSARQKKAPSRG